MFYSFNEDMIVFISCIMIMQGQVVKKACYSTKSLSLNIFVTQRNKTNQVWHKSTSTSKYLGVVFVFIFTECGPFSYNATSGVAVYDVDSSIRYLFKQLFVLKG